MVDFAKAATEAAQKLGMIEDPAMTTPAPATEESTPVEETTAPITESAEPVEDELEVAQPKLSTTIPISRFNEVYREKKELERLLAGIVNKFNEAEVARATPQQPAQPIEEPDFDLMSNREMAQWTVKQMQQLGGVMKEAIRQEVEPIRSHTAQQTVNADIQSTAAKHSDFKDYLPQMIELAEKHPTLNSEQVYQLASGNVGAVKKSVGAQLQAKVEAKKAARTETRSTAGGVVAEAKQFKSVRDSAMEVARKLKIL